MEYREQPAPPDLAAFVRCFWTLCGEAAPGAAERLLPDGRIELAIHFGDPFDRVVSPDGRERQPRGLFVGQLDQHVLLAPAGRVRVFGVCFHPDGASAFAHWPQHQTAGRILALEDVWASAGRRLQEAVCNAQDDSGRIAAVQSFLRRQMRARDADRRLRAAVDLFQREPWLRVEQVAGRAGSSRRHLERAFIERVGCTPKTFAKIARFQRVLSLREQRPQWGWARVAAESGYYDQAHLIADFRRFSGSTPALHPEDITAMERLFLHERG